MKTHWIGKSNYRGLKKTLRSLTYHVLVDVLPVLLLLAAMAYGMAIISNSLSRTEELRRPAVAENHS